MVALQIGLYLLLASGLGGMLLPALIIVPAHIIRWLSGLSATFTISILMELWRSTVHCWSTYCVGGVMLSRAINHGVPL